MSGKKDKKILKKIAIKVDFGCLFIRSLYCVFYRVFIYGKNFYIYHELKIISLKIHWGNLIYGLEELYNK